MLENKDFILQYILDNHKYKSVRIMAEELNVTYNQLDHFVKKMKLKKPARFNENFFENIDTENKAYWLGFIYADGFVMPQYKRFTINLAQTDHDHLVKLSHDLESINQVKKFDHHIRKRGTCYKQSKISLQSEKLVSDLIDKGCLPNKTFKLTYPYWMDIQLRRHFIRGYIDGDGCIMTYLIRGEPKSQISILGTEDMLIGIKNEMNLTCNVCKRQNIFELRTGGNNLMRKIGVYLYKDATIFMDRKKAKIDYLLGDIDGD